MKIAICLYGQPRLFETGFKTLQKFIEINTPHEFDFFFHAWKLKEGQSYNASSWSETAESDLQFMSNLEENLCKLFKPKLYEVEQQIESFPIDENYQKLINNLTDPLKVKNTTNILSQHYSREKARNILLKYIMKKNLVYDFVVMARFDLRNPISLLLSSLNSQKTHVSYLGNHKERKYLPDHFIVAPQHVFLNWFCVKDNVRKLVKNDRVKKRLEEIGLTLELNAEEFFAANFLYYYDIEQVNYSDKIPNFI